MSLATLEKVKEAGQDFEWYPTTAAMIAAVARTLSTDRRSIMDIGAGDGRVLLELAKRSEHGATLYAIEKSSVLSSTWPNEIIPVGTDFFEQNLSCLQTDVIFCNPPYLQYESWVTNIIESGYAERAYLVIPQRWKTSGPIKEAIEKRKVRTRVIFTGDFLEADRRSRAVVEIVEVTFRQDKYERQSEDPFDHWFDQNVSTFDQEKEVDEGKVNEDLAKRHDMDTITGMVDAFNEEYARMQDNYKAIFKLDFAILKELGVNKDGIRKGLKLRMTGLKTKYWKMLFDRLTALTSRLCTDTKKKFLEKLTGNMAIAFTASNAYSIVIWAIKNANKYFDEQLIKLFRDLSDGEGIKNYKSNTKVWAKGGWRYHNEQHSHYALDYRFVLNGYQAIPKDKNGFGNWDYPNGLHKAKHEQIADIVAVLGNLGFNSGFSLSSLHREWVGGQWQDFFESDGETLFQVKAYINGNIHFRFKPEAIKALNVEAGRLLGWIHGPNDVVAELGYTPEEADKLFKSHQMILPSNVKLLTA